VTKRTKIAAGVVASGLLAGLLFLSASRREPSAKECKAPVDQRLVAANTRFGLKLFKELVRRSNGHNVCVSPSLDYS
jgi:hypothetical protein